MLLLQPILNGRRLDTSLFIMRRGDDILLSANGAAEMGIAAPRASEDVRGVQFVSSREYPSMRLEIDERRGELRVRCAADCFSSSQISVRDDETPELSPVSTGAFINYDLYAQVGDPSTQVGAFVEAGFFSGAGTILSSMACSNNRLNGDCVRLESNWTIDDPRSLRRLQIGDTITRADGWGAPIRFGGVRWGTDFSLRPDFITFPTPSLKGDAALPGVAEVFINDARRFESGLPAGPFSISDLPTVTGAGAASVVVTDLLGRETVITADYYAAPQLLRRGLSAYSLEAGVEREDYGARSNAYGDAFAAAGFGVGVTDWMTTRLRAEIGESQQAAGASFALASPAFGLVEVSGAVSHVDGRYGERIDIAHEWRSANYSFGGKATYTSEDFRQLGQESPSPKLSIRSFASVSVKDFGSASANWIYSDMRGGDDFSAAGLRYSVTLGRASLNLSALQTFRPEDNTTVSFYVSVPFGGGASASAGVDYDGERFGGDLRMRKSAPQEGGFGYRARFAKDGVDRYEAGGEYRASFGEFSAEFSKVNAAEAGRFSARGGAAIVGGEAFLARSVTDSFAVASVGKEIGVRVYQDGQFVGETNSRGKVVVPRLRRFEQNVISFQPEDLSLAASFEETKTTITPGYRTGHKVAFSVRHSVNVIAEIVGPNGAPIPEGAELLDLASNARYPVATDGRIFIAGAQERVRLQYSVAGRRCEASLNAPAQAGAAPIVNLGKVACVSYKKEV